MKRKRTTITTFSPFEILMMNVVIAIAAREVVLLKKQPDLRKQRAMLHAGTLEHYKFRCEAVDLVTMWAEVHGRDEKTPIH